MDEINDDQIKGREIDNGAKFHHGLLSITTRELTVRNKESGFPFLSVIIRHALVISAEASQYCLICGGSSKGVGLPKLFILPNTKEERIEKVRNCTMEDSLRSRTWKIMIPR